ncbi:SPFH domain-containing protein [Nesterenkonia populi]|uniref:SPFH domain-containing protein n=1 Tax=Nesterenkonia populi TaxID=1591087 RepID=UPI0011BF890D|nr:SPFH domain-containing protein [Nesterenkonia populi]
MDFILLLIGVVFLLFVVVVLINSVKIIPQARAGIVERLGKYHRTLQPGLALLVPFFDRLRPLLDMREQVVSFPPQSVITEDNLVVDIDTVVYFQITDPKAATYEIQNYIVGVEQLTTTTLRNVVGGMNLEKALTSRDDINSMLRGELDKVTGRWGIRVARVELKAIDPPHSIQDSMEQQMRAERSRRAAILTAEGNKQSAVLNAEGERQASILQAEGEAQSRILAANAEAQAIETVFNAVHASEPSPELLSYQYLQSLPEMAKSESNTMFFIPGEFGEALKSLSGAFGGGDSGSSEDGVSFEEKEKIREARAERLRARREQEQVEAASRPGKPGISNSIADLAESARATSVTDDASQYESAADLENAAKQAKPGKQSGTPAIGEESAEDVIARVAEESPGAGRTPEQQPPRSSQEPDQQDPER